MESVTNSFFATGWILGTPQWVVLSVAVMQVDRVGLQSKLQLSLMPGKPLKWGMNLDLGPVAGGNAASAPTHDSAASPSPLCLLLAGSTSTELERIIRPDRFVCPKTCASTEYASTRASYGRGL